MFMIEECDISRLTNINLSAVPRENIKTFQAFKWCRITVVIRKFGTIVKRSLKVLLLLSPPSLLGLLFLSEIAQNIQIHVILLQRLQLLLLLLLILL